MNMRDFSAANLERCEDSDGFNHEIDSWSPSDWLTAVLGELGESANLIKKLNRVRDGIPGNSAEETELVLRARLQDELADTYIYLDLLSQALGINLSEAVVDKFNKTSKKIGYSKKLTPFGLRPV